MTTGAVLITGVIEAHEERDTTTCDIPGAFLHADNDETVLMLLRGKLAELLVKVDPKLYRKYVITLRKGILMLYVKLSKALYGMLRSALLFYKKLASELIKMGFEINPYNPCVANKMINGCQMTVC